MREEFFLVAKTSLAASVSFQEPWKLTLAERLGQLTPGTTRVGYFYEVSDPGSFRYRAYNMAQTLNALSDTYSASYFFLSDIPLVEDFSDYIDILVLVRFRFGGSLGRMVDQFRAAGKPVAFDIDDLIFDARHTPMVASTLNFGLEPGLVLDNWFALTSRLGATLELCDAALTTTPTLATEISKVSSLKAYVVPNFLNEEQIVASASAAATQEAGVQKASDTFTIGYFSGSKSHARDFAVAAPALSEFLARHPHARLTIAGILDVPGELVHQHHQIHRLPFMDYLSLQSAVAQVDLNIVPLQLNVFTDSKSELKFFEAAAVNTPTLASPTEVYRRVIEDGTTGWITTHDGWLEALERIISLEGGQRANVSTNARNTVMETYTGTAQLSTISLALEGIAS